jgi:hypothetical protein
VKSDKPAQRDLESQPWGCYNKTGKQTKPTEGECTVVSQSQFGVLNKTGEQRKKVGTMRMESKTKSFALRPQTLKHIWVS